jgi:hypothetical protein
VLRRCPTPLTMLVAALACGLGLRPSLTEAASSTPPSISTYSWTNSVSFPALGSNPTGPQIEFLVQPYGSLVAYSSSTGPLAGPISVNPALSSSNQVYVGLKDATSSTGQPEQFLGLFFSNGLNAGSVLKVPLYYNTSTPPTLVPQTAGVGTYTASSGGSTSGNGGSTSSSGGSTSSSGGSTNSSPGSQASGAPGGGDGGITAAQTPEPLSLLIWTAFLGVALARSKFLRRSTKVAISG